MRAILAGRPGWSAVDAFRATIALQAYQRAGRTLVADVDVLVLPTCADHLSRARSAGRAARAQRNLGRYTNFVNLLDMSAVAVPAGFRDNHTGFGVSLIGPAWADRRRC